MSRSLLVAALLAASSACSAPPPARVTEPPAKVANPAKEADLATVTLTAEAETRLALRTAAVEERMLAGARRMGGEVVVPPGRALTVAAPLAGTLLSPVGGGVPPAGSAVRKGQVVFRLRPLPGAAELAAAAARREVVRAKVRRAEQLLEAGATSARVLEEARAELAAAEAGAQALSPADDSGSGDVLVLASPEEGVISALRVAPGQSVAAATPLFEVVAADPLWVRVPVYVGDAAAIDAASGAVVHFLSDASGARGRPARMVAGPPTADPLAATSDVFFQAGNADGALRPGQRVEVVVRLLQPERVRVVPWSAVVYDIHGGAWVYENTAPHVFVRRRVNVRRVDGDVAVLASGPGVGASVLSVGAAEVFGTELGSGK